MVTVEQFCKLHLYQEVEDVLIYRYPEPTLLFLGSYIDAIRSQYADQKVWTFYVEGGVVCLQIMKNENEAQSGTIPPFEDV